MNVRILFFGRLGEMIGREQRLDLPSEVRTIADLRAWLARRHPEADADLTGPRVRACIDDEMATDEAVLPRDAEIAFFPPLSGG